MPDDLLTRARRVADLASSDDRAELIGRLCDRLAEVTEQRDAAAAELVWLLVTKVGHSYDTAVLHARTTMLIAEPGLSEAARLAALVFGEGGSDGPKD